MGDPIYLNKEQFCAVSLSAGLNLDHETLEEYFQLYVQYVAPILARLHRHQPLESEVDMPTRSDR